MELIRINKKKIITTISILCLIGAIFIIFTSALLSKDTIYSNIYINDVDVSGLSVEDAEEKLTTIYKNRLETMELNLVHGNYKMLIKAENIDYTYKFKESIQDAHKIGRNISVIESIKEIFSLRTEPIVVPLKSTYNEMRLNELIERISSEINREAVNASIQKNSNGFVIVDEIPGVIVNKRETKENILLGFEGLDSLDVDISINNVMPNITKEQLSAIDHLVSEFKTSFNPQIVGRVRNIEVAANRVNGTLLMPMEIFSFNDITGSRSKAGGYHEAPIISNGKFVPGVGGGVCQVSTTLYNAVIRSDLAIVERRNHSLPVAYVPLGHDATVTDNYIDFKFQNNKIYPIYIESKVQGDSLFVRIYGQKKGSTNTSIDLHSQITEVISPRIEVKKDPNMNIGEKKVIQEAKNGYRVDTFKVYYEAGVQVRREHISRDFYKPIHGEIIEGARPVDVINKEQEIEEVNINESEVIDY